MASNISQPHHNTGEFGTINPLHYNNYIEEESETTMTEISINEKTGDLSKGGNLRPATLPISSPFGPPKSGSYTPSNANESYGDGESAIEKFVKCPKTPMDAFKEWSITTFKCTKQMVNEKMGKVQRTVDIPLESEIEKLRDTQRKYQSILKIARDMMNMYATLVQQQTLLYESLNELALKEIKSGRNKESSNQEKESESNDFFNISSDFRQNSEMLKQVAKSGEKLILALKFFCNNLSTLVNKTIEDTITTIRAYEQARLEFDAEKNSQANLLPAQTSGISNTEKLINCRAKYEKLRSDVNVKMKFLEENRAKVMHKQLVLFHNAFAAYASGNLSGLDSTLKQFSIKGNPVSWLEK